MNESHKIKHLSLRAGFGLSPAEWEKMRKLNLKEATERLFQKKTATLLSVPQMDIPDDDEIQKATKEKRDELQKKARQLCAKVNGEWLGKMIYYSYF